MKDAIEQCDPQRPQQKTNVEKVTQFMEYGSPLNQAFVMAALDHYTNHVKQHEAELKANQNSFINGSAWVACAYDWANLK